MEARLRVPASPREPISAKAVGRPAAPAAPGDWRPRAPSPPRAAWPAPRDRGIAQPLATKSVDRLRAAWDDRSLVLLAGSACSARAPA